MIGGKALLDTGPLVAYLHRNERDHERCRDLLKAFRGVLITTEAVVTETTHLLDGIPNGSRACLDFFLHHGAEISPSTRNRLERCFHLMGRYADTPMDYADATLVALAEETGIRDVFTLDRRGFATYRANGKEAFRIHP